jgi:indolepyruvate ferredoxin oxidoreductase beta subunit
VIINQQRVTPMTVATGSAEYPAGIVAEIKKQISNTILCPGMELSEQAGSAKTINIVLVGALARQLAIPKETWVATISGRVPPKTVAMNTKAFELGYGS